MLRATPEDKYNEIVTEINKLEKSEQILKSGIRDLEITIAGRKKTLNRLKRERKGLIYEKNHFWQRIRAKEQREKKKEPVMFDLCEPEK